jgi:DNA-binding beta-propeller fold protein YncE
MSTAPWGVSSSGSGIMQLVVTPNGQTAYLTAGGDTNDAVIPVNLRTRQAGREVAMPDVVQSLALSPNGKVVYAGLWDNDGIVPVDVATGKAGRRVAFSGYVSSMAVAP